MHICVGNLHRVRRSNEALDQIRDLADARLITACVYCGAPDDTRDHVPSRVFMDAPYPANLPVVPCCASCNASFSRDEEYLAAVLECAIAGSTDPQLIRRPKVAAGLQRSTRLRAAIEQCFDRSTSPATLRPDEHRIRNVVLKLARGHAAFELSTPCQTDPSLIVWWPLEMMSAEQRENFDAPVFSEVFGEVGSRGLQRLHVVQVSLQDRQGQPAQFGYLATDWIPVQTGRYRYIAYDEPESVIVRIVLGEYLACHVAWERDVLT